METVKTIEYLRSQYSNKNLRRQYTWATDVRAGIILQYAGKVLVVQQRAYGNNKSNHGFPKGGMERQDKSAIDTAVRELFEETGIDLLNPCLDARLASVVIGVERPNNNNELHLYFLAQVAEEPSVSICPRELVGYKWVESAEICSLTPVSRATGMLMRGLRRVNMSSRCNILTSVNQLLLE